MSSFHSIKELSRHILPRIRSVRYSKVSLTTFSAHYFPLNGFKFNLAYILLFHVIRNDSRAFYKARNAIKGGDLKNFQL
ncbi:MAG: hypothetical protein IJX25_04220 [Clostridia bacterium]|nr:hypothetical protein [Clostridia bacterium]